MSVAEQKAARERMLTPVEVAELLGLSVKAVRGLIARGELGAHRIANKIRVDPADFEAFLEATRLSVPSPTAPARPGERRQARGDLARILEV